MNYIIQFCVEQRDNPRHAHKPDHAPRWQTAIDFLNQNDKEGLIAYGQTFAARGWRGWQLLMKMLDDDVDADADNADNAAAFDAPAHAHSALINEIERHILVEPSTRYRQNWENMIDMLRDDPPRHPNVLNGQRDVNYWLDEAREKGIDSIKTTLPKAIEAKGWKVWADTTDGQWKEKDSWRICRQNGLLYKEYGKALQADKERLGNTGQAIAGNVQKTLVAEMRYITGATSGGYYGDEAIRTIKQLYDLPCWGALDRKARKRFASRIGMDLLDEARKDIRKQWRELHPDAPETINYALRDDPWSMKWAEWSKGKWVASELWNKVNQHIHYSREFFNNWNQALNYKQQFKDVLPERCHQALDDLDEHLPLRYYMEQGISVPTTVRTTADVEMDIKKAMVAGDWLAVQTLAAEMKELIESDSAEALVED